jgi:hypothetical protein
MNYHKNFLMPKIAFFTVLISAAMLYKISFILGSFTALFSGVAIILPLTGAFTGLAGSFFVGLSLLCLRMLSHGFMLPLHFAAYHIPGLFASLYWARESLLIRFLVPVACMVAFCFHPVGGAAWAYSLFWLIPVFLYIKKYDSVIATSLGSTFVAHGVGSVIWLYTVPMTAGQWLSLIPVVCIERMIFAAGMVIMHTAITSLFSLISSYKKQFMARIA